MGKIPQGILGGVSGKVGGVVGSSWKGISVVKTKPLSVANPRTAPQVGQRTRFSLVVQDGTALLSSIVKPLWDRSAVKMSGFNSFIKANIENFDTAGPIDPAQFVIAKGKMQAASTFDVTFDPSIASLTVEWPTTTTDPFGMIGDEVFVVVRKFKAGNELAEGIKLAETRQDGLGVFAAPSWIDPLEPTWAYLAFRRSDGTVVSNTAATLVTFP